MTESEYLARLAMRCNDWREKYPDRADELRPRMRGYLGISLRQSTDSRLAASALEQGENELIRIFQGWPGREQCVTEQEPPPPSAQRHVPPPKDFEPSGRDRAAGVEE